MTEDAFGTSALRRAVTEAWLASPTRFREDANTEEDHARGYYRDRVVVELAQNAADAASHAGVPGHLGLRLARDEAGSWWLTARNSGAPLDADGVASMASMRASTKVVARDVRAPSGEDPAGPTTQPPFAHGSPRRVGRFGVGFAAVRSVADVVSARSVLGGVEFSSERTRSLLDGTVAASRAGGSDGRAAADRLEAAVRDRGDVLPVLRLPFAAPALVPGPGEPGSATPVDTLVSLRLRDSDAVDVVRRLLDEVDDALLLALPALVEVVVEVEDEGGTFGRRRLHDVASRWTVVREAGVFEAALLATLPVEQRQAGWSLLWALPRTSPSVAGPSALDGVGEPGAPRAAGTALLSSTVLHAPTPTDEPLTFLALLVASFPLDPSRRHVLAGPVSDALAVRAGESYARLLGQVAAERGASVLGLVPTGLPAGALDSQVREAALGALRGTPLLSPVVRRAADDASGDDALLRGGPGVALDEGFDGGAAPDDLVPRLSSTGPHLVPPQDAQVLAGEVGRDPEVVRVLGSAVPDLVDVPSPLLPVARSLGVRLRDLADVIEDLPTGWGPAAWREVYAALAPHVGQPGVLDALGGVTVPLADGRTVRGARGALLLADDVPDAGPGRAGEPGYLALARSLGLRLVHPDAAHPLLERLGATPSSARALLAEPAVREHVLHLADGAADDDTFDSFDDASWTGSGADHEDPDETPSRGEAHAVVPGAVGQVLALVRAALAEGAQPGDLPFWLGELPLPTADGDLAPARECVLPGSWSATHLDGLVPLAPGVVDLGEDVLRAVGVQVDVSVYRVPDVLTPWDEGADLPDDPDDPQSWLTGWADYLAFLGAHLGAGAYVGDLDGVADLDAVADDSWPAVLARLADDPDARAALLAPVRGQGSAGVRETPSYTAWWLRAHLGAPFAAEPGGVPFLADPPPAVRGLDAQVVRALGGVARLDELDLADWPGYLSALPDVGAPLALPAALAVWQGLGALAQAAQGRELDDLPDRLPALRAGDVRCVAADDLAVATSAMWAQTRTVVPVEVSAGEALADLLDLPLLPTPGTPEVPSPDGAGSPQAVDARVAALVPGVPVRWFEHDELSVGGVEVDWWVCAGGDGPQVHASTTSGLARGLATAAGLVRARHLLESALLDPGSAPDLLAETAWDGTPAGGAGQAGVGREGTGASR